MFQLRFTTLVEAPLTVAFDVARTLGRPWGETIQSRMRGYERVFGISIATSCTRRNSRSHIR